MLLIAAQRGLTGLANATLSTDLFSVDTDWEISGAGASTGVTDRAAGLTKAPQALIALCATALPLSTGLKAVLEVAHLLTVQACGTLRV